MFGKEGLGIREKLLLGILPFVIIGMIVLTAISAYFSGESIENQISETMNSEIKANVNFVDNKLTFVLRGETFRDGRKLTARTAPVGI